MANAKAEKPHVWRRGFSFDKANPDGVFSASTKRLAIQNGTFSPAGEAPKDKPALKREK